MVAVYPASNTSSFNLGKWNPNIRGPKLDIPDADHSLSYPYYGASDYDEYDDPGTGQFIALFDRVVVEPVLVATCFVSSFLNFLIVTSAHWMKRPLPTATCFTLAVAGADCWASLCVGGGLLLKAHFLSPDQEPELLNPPVYCWTLTFEGFRLGAVITSSLQLMLLAYIHSGATTRTNLVCQRSPALIVTQFSAQLTYAAILLVFLAPPCILFIAFAVFPNQGYNSYHCMMVDMFHELPFRAIVTVFVFLPFGVTVFFYVKLLWHLTRQRRRLSSTGYGSGSACSGGGGMSCCFMCRRYRKILITVAIIITSFFFGWVPESIMFLALCPNCSAGVFLLDYPRLAYTIVTTCNALLVLKFVTNPFLYAARVPCVKGVIARVPLWKGWWQHRQRWRKQRNPPCCKTSTAVCGKEQIHYGTVVRCF